MKKMLAALALIAAGCSNRPTLFDNPDPALNRTKTEFSGDAAERVYPGVPSKHTTLARAQVGYSLNRLEVVQWTDQDWRDVEVWVNGKYVCYVPKMESRKLKEVHFPMLYDQNGNPFPMDNSRVRVERVELHVNGQFYGLTVKPADF